MNFYNIFFSLTGILLVLIDVPAIAQKDTLGKGVDIVSSFRPTIQTAAKIEFSPGSVAPDTTRPALQYVIPNQQLLVGYAITSLRPLAYTTDSVRAFVAHPFIKIGYGNLKTPYLQIGQTWGDGYSKGLQLNASHISSKGKLAVQQYSNTQASLGAFKRLEPSSLRLEGTLSMTIDKLNKYGYAFATPAPSTVPLEDSVQQRFIYLKSQVSVSSTKPTSVGVSYSALFKIDRFTNKDGTAETGLQLYAPLQKMLGQKWRVDLLLNTDWSTLHAAGKRSITNTVASLSPTIKHWSDGYSIQAGIRPSWDQHGFRIFPAINASFNLADERFAVLLGWEGYLQKTTYRSLSTQNPWLWLPASLLNTAYYDKYLGIKANVGNHFFSTAKVSFAAINNMPLFTNDTTAAGDGKSFSVGYEARLRRLQFKSEFSYQVAERFQAGASFTINQFSGLRSYTHAWGLIPMEVNATMRVNVLKDLLIKADLFAWRGARFLQKDGSMGRLSGAADLSAGMEFKVTDFLRIWAQFNNLFNTTYQRWSQYPVYGFNCTAGVVFSPFQKNKN